MVQAEEWTIRRLLEWTTVYLKDHGSESPRLEAEVLLAHALGCSRIELYTGFDNVPEESNRARFRDSVKRRSAGEPVAYLTGHKEFYSLDFKVTSDVLIPRPETEQLVLEVIEQIKRAGQQVESGPRILELGTGSGNIAITLAKNLERVQITAVDQSEKALSIAQENARRHDVLDKITFVHSDLFENVPKEPLFDVLVSNPPYVRSDEYEQLEPMVRNFEPKEALWAGPNGTEIMERILSQAPQFLGPNASFFIEGSPTVFGRLETVLNNAPQWKEVRFIKDFSGKQRIVTGRLNNK